MNLTNDLSRQLGLAHPISLSLAVAVALTIACGSAWAAGVYGCQDARGHLTYSTAPCAPGATALPIDSTGAEARAMPQEASRNVAPFTPGSPGHQLTPAEQDRVARLRSQERNAPAEA